MIFHSLSFALFFVVVFAVYWKLGKANQNLFLLLSSYLFYGWVHPWFCILLIGSSVLDFYMGLGMQRHAHRKKLFLLGSLIANLGLLGFFKYSNFFITNVNEALSLLGIENSLPVLNVLLPVGISFYTFQTLSYSIDVYREKFPPTKNFVDFLTYVSFFPQLVAGPIERAEAFLPQVESSRSWDYARATEGLLLCSWGLFKKLVIADNVAMISNKVFALGDSTGPLIVVGTLAFCFQIYADFSAYSDIARGAAKLLGFELMLNFRQPYLSLSPSEFWQRWHISLSSWIRDYLYIPLGGNRGTAARKCAVLLGTFTLCGLWHGASWNFVFWGAYHGLIIFLHRLLSLITKPLPSALKWLVTFALTNFGWLIFRETDFGHLSQMISRLGLGWVAGVDLATALFMCFKVVIFSLPLWISDFILEKRPAVLFRESQKWTAFALRFIFLAATIFLTMLFYAEDPSDFIYFQF